MLKVRPFSRIFLLGGKYLSISKFLFYKKGGSRKLFFLDFYKKDIKPPFQRISCNLSKRNIFLFDFDFLLLSRSTLIYDSIVRRNDFIL